MRFLMMLLCMEFLTFCNFDKNHNGGLTLKDNYYNIEFIEFIDKRIPMIDHDIISIRRHSEYISQISNWGYYDGVVKFIYSWNKKNHLFDGDDLEIVFTRERVGKRSLMRPENYIISVKKVKDKLKAILIIWQNGGELPKKDTNKLYLGDREYDLSAEDNTGKYFSNNMKFEWEIGATTDTLWTNLSKEILQKLYPKFSGKYHEIKVDSIFVNYDYPIETYDFYNNIYFNNFKLGFTRDYCKIIDFIKKMH